eukprot:5549736-Lingulodinium_polyedra.AAC.1
MQHPETNLKPDCFWRFGFPVVDHVVARVAFQLLRFAMSWAAPLEHAARYDASGARPCDNYVLQQTAIAP